MQPIESSASWRSSCAPDEVWSALTDVDAYGSWWPWLEHMDADRWVAGAFLTATIRAPAGYRVRYRVRFTEVERPRRIVAAIDGDLGGRATIELHPDGTGTIVRFRSSLRPRRALLRMASVVVEPVLVHGHDRIMGRGVGEFVAGTGIDLTPVDVTVDRGASPRQRTVLDVVRAAAVAGVVSGVPSTAHAVVTGSDPLLAARAAGALLGRPTLARGVVAHTLVSVAWAAVLAVVLPRRGATAVGAAAGVVIAAIDLGVVGRRIPAIRDLPVAPQVADHLAFGALVGMTLGHPRRPSV